MDQDLDKRKGADGPTAPTAAHGDRPPGSRARSLGDTPFAVQMEALTQDLEAGGFLYIDGLPPGRPLDPDVGKVLEATRIKAAEGRLEVSAFSGPIGARLSRVLVHNMSLEGIDVR